VIGQSNHDPYINCKQNTRFPILDIFKHKRFKLYKTPNIPVIINMSIADVRFYDIGWFRRKSGTPILVLPFLFLDL